MGFLQGLARPDENWIDFCVKKTGEIIALACLGRSEELSEVSGLASAQFFYGEFHCDSSFLFKN